MKYSTFGLLLCLISLPSLADSLCDDGYFNAEFGICQSGGGANYYPGQKTARTYQPRDYYGAIATDVVNGENSSAANDYTSIEEAEAAALKDCGNSHCRIVISYKDACAATAVILGAGPQTVVGAIGSSPSAAERNAMSRCRDNGGGSSCHIWAKARCSLPK